jgi:hypothetical protein
VSLFAQIIEAWASGPQERSYAVFWEKPSRCASRGYDDVEHRAQGLDATFTNNEYLIRITDITAKPRSYAGLLGFSKPTRV